MKMVQKLPRANGKPQNDDDDDDDNDDEVVKRLNKKPLEFYHRHIFPFIFFFLETIMNE